MLYMYVTIAKIKVELFDFECQGHYEWRIRLVWSTWRHSPKHCYVQLLRQHTDKLQSYTNIAKIGKNKQIDIWPWMPKPLRSQGQV